MDDAAFLAAICNAPGDPVPRLVFADYLELQGRHAEAMGQRWAAREGKFAGPAGWWADGSIPTKPSTCLPAIFQKAHPDVIYRSYQRPGEEAFVEACRRIQWSATGDPVPAGGG